MSFRRKNNLRVALSEQNIAKKQRLGATKENTRVGTGVSFIRTAKQEKSRLVTEYSSPLAVKGKKSTGIPRMIYFTKNYTKQFFVVEQALSATWKYEIPKLQHLMVQIETDELTDGMDQDPDEADEDIQNDIKLKI